LDFKASFNFTVFADTFESPKKPEKKIVSIKRVVSYVDF
jgi:hypothetical protein